MLEAVAIGYATDVALKYQLYYQEGVKAQSQIVTTLINAVESELDKSFLTLLATTDSETKLFSSELSNACRTEIDALEALYPEQELNNSYPSVTPSIRKANRRLANLQHCQQNQLNLVIAKLESLINGNIEGLDHLTVRQLYRRVLNAKIKIVETANQQLADVGTKLQAHMRAEGLSAIDRLFGSGSVEQAHSYFIQQAEAVAIDEMSRSLFGRPATERERNNKYFIIQAGYETCSRIGMLAGDPNFVGCTQYSWIPEERKHFDPSKDDVISRMVMPTRDAIKRFFLQSLDQLILNGWNNLHEEAWLERQIISFSEKQRILKKAETDRALVMRWLFDSSKEIVEECGSGNACAAWSSSYLAGQQLSPHSSLQHIASWYESNNNSNLYVHSARLAKLDGLIRSALESEWQANHVNSFYSYIFPGSFDLEKHAPLIASALNVSGLDTTNLASALPLAKSVVKTRLSEAMSVADSNGEEWLLTQIGDFQRYLAIVHNQHNSTGHFASGEVGTTTLFSEPLPAHLLRYMTLDFYHTIDGNNFDEYYFPITGEAPSYDACSGIVNLVT
ncbi:hypothetical protein SKA34_07843 [Photobacterium sp. SKA34]|uniref:hypothetical protein n=1 Tax=Photobacterium sp. SKA34 TaxID=121723 RepID=UPI00006B4098|nr:hypothetical protein [Photobacterium sp. SKA34]EAR57481.1 hypothetical protein SKA34_07843 [Photobacterium sp. SKA34]